MQGCLFWGGGTKRYATQTFREDISSDPKFITAYISNLSSINHLISGDTQKEYFIGVKSYLLKLDPVSP